MWIRISHNSTLPEPAYIQYLCVRLGDMGASRRKARGARAERLLAERAPAAPSALVRESVRVGPKI